jgi:hypothetical protein
VTEKNIRKLRTNLSATFDKRNTLNFKLFVVHM